jgi:hypothetical protein
MDSIAASHGTTAKTRTAVARAQRVYAVTPRDGGAAYLKGISHGAIALEHDAPGIIADGAIRQHIRGPFECLAPADAIRATGEFGWLAGLNVFGQGRKGRWNTRYGPAVGLPE